MLPPANIHSRAKHCKAGPWGHPSAEAGLGQAVGADGGDS